MFHLQQHKDLTANECKMQLLYTRGGLCYLKLLWLKKKVHKQTEINKGITAVLIG